MSRLGRTLYTGPWRGWLRRLGVAALPRAASTWRGRWRRHVFRTRRPHVAEVNTAFGPVRGHCVQVDEYLRVRSLGDDRHLLRALRPHVAADSVVWDVGSNLGLYAAALARGAPAGRVLAFEPEPRARARLMQNLALNGLAHVHALPFALGAEDGTCRFYTATTGAAGTHSLVNQGGATGVLEVEVRRGDDLIDSGALPAPHVLKVDVEGAEEGVLLGLERALRSPRCRALLLEMHFAVLAAAGAADAPRRICARLAEWGLADQRFVDRSHLLAVRA